MAEELVSSTIAAPGFNGINTQESSIQLDSGFASLAFNCIIDKFGRIGSRKGWQKVNSVNTDLGSNSIQFMFEMREPSGNHLLSAGNNKLFVGTSTLTQKTVRNSTDTGDVAYTITANHWQAAALPYGDGTSASPHAYLVQAGHPMLVFHKLGATSHAHTGSYGFQQFGDIGTLPTGYSTSDFKPNCVLAAYGRIWVADIVGDRQIVYFSRLLDGSDFYGGDSGSLSLNSVFPNNDQIVALAAHNGFLIVFGTNNIAIYANPIDVTELKLAEFIPNIGCVARDSVVSTGTDIIFLSNNGVRSLTRLVQEKSLPFRDISKNVRDELLFKVASESNKINIKATYFENDAFYLLAIPNVNEVYCFDLRTYLPDGSARATIWNSIKPTAFVVTEDRKLYLGKVGYIGNYTGYVDDASSYRMIYFTNYFDLGEPTLRKLLKKINWVLVGANNQAIITKYGFDYLDSYQSVSTNLAASTIYEYGIDEYNIAEYSTGIIVGKFGQQLGGTGSVIQIGLETEINTNAVSIQKIDCFVKLGKKQ